jgi:hypothetical protein
VSIARKPTVREHATVVLNLPLFQVIREIPRPFVPALIAIRDVEVIRTVEILAWPFPGRDVETPFMSLEPIKVLGIVLAATLSRAFRHVDLH